MNILVAINKSYTSQMVTLLKSIEKTNKNKEINVYVLNREIEKFPVYEKRYPVEIYFRLFATKYLPKDINRILYLDVDTIVINSLDKLYNMDFENNLFIGSTHINKNLHKFNINRFGVDKNYFYVNTGVLMMNLEELRKIPVEKEVISFIKKYKTKLMLPDQDIIFALYGNRIKEVDSLIYNLGDRDIRKYNLVNKEQIDLDWVKKHSVIIHYYGRNKPWNKNYNGILNYFYNEIVK